MRRGAAELVVAGRYATAGSEPRVWLDEGAGSAQQTRLLEEALAARTGPLAQLAPDRPVWLTLAEDPFQPGSVFLRKFELEWMLILPAALDDPHSGWTGFVALAGRDRRDRDDPVLQTVLSAWRILVREFKQGAARSRLVPAPLPEWWEQAPAALAIVTDDRVVLANVAARQLLSASVGADGRAWAAWLVGSVRRLEEAGSDDEVLPASQSRRHSLGIALGPEVPELGGRLVAIRDASTDDRTGRETAVTISTLSHELRNPLTALQNGLDLVLREEAGPLGPDQRRFLALARRNIERLDRLVTDLLDLTRVQAGALALKRRPLDIVPLLSESLEILAPTAREREIALDLCAPETFTAYVDPDKLHQILENLLGNALKFTESGGYVRTTLQERGGPAEPLAERFAERYFLPLRSFRLEIEDNGPGMDEELQAEVFLPFRRGETASPYEAPGAGLGLYITRCLVEAHAGRIELASRPAQGTTVSIELPRDPESEQLMRGVRTLSEALAEAGERAGAEHFAVLDLRRPGLELLPEEREQAAVVIKRFLTRLAPPESNSKVAVPGCKIYGLLGVPVLAELNPGLFVTLAQHTERLQTAWEIEVARPGVPVILVGSYWELPPVEFARVGEEADANAAVQEAESPGGAAKGATKDANEVDGAPEGETSEEPIRPLGAGNTPGRC
jgi:signal transduction histidine kinase